MSEHPKHRKLNKTTEEVVKEDKKAENDNRFKKYFVATRPWSFSASLVPGTLGNVIIYIEQGEIDLLLSLVSVICILAVHCAGNLVNTYYDYHYGVDQHDSDDTTLVHEILTPDEVAKLGIISYTVGCISFILIVFLSKAYTEYLVLIFFTGLSGSYVYTGSVGMKYHGLGDMLIMLTFGPVSVLFTYIIQSGHFSWAPVVYSIPLMLGSEAILHSNNTRDFDSDNKVGIVTLAILLGKGLSYVLYIILLFGPYEYVVVLSVIQSKYFMIPLLTLPLALDLEKKFRRRELKNIAQETAQLSFLFGILYVSVFIVNWYLGQH